MGQQTSPGRMLAGERHRPREVARIVLPTSAGWPDSGRRSVSRELASLALDAFGAFA